MNGSVRVGLITVVRPFLFRPGFESNKTNYLNLPKPLLKLNVNKVKTVNITKGGYIC